VKSASANEKAARRTGPAGWAGASCRLKAR